MRVSRSFVQLTACAGPAEGRAPAQAERQGSATSPRSHSQAHMTCSRSCMLSSPSSCVCLLEKTGRPSGRIFGFPGVVVEKLFLRVALRHAPAEECSSAAAGGERGGDGWGGGGGGQVFGSVVCRFSDSVASDPTGKQTDCRALPQNPLDPGRLLSLASVCPFCCQLRSGSRVLYLGSGSKQIFSLCGCSQLCGCDSVSCGCIHAHGFGGLGRTTHSLCMERPNPVGPAYLSAERS